MQLHDARIVGRREPNMLLNNSNFDSFSIMASIVDIDLQLISVRIVNNDAGGGSLTVSHQESYEIFHL